jgi:hypothetical protein
MGETQKQRIISFPQGLTLNAGSGLTTLLGGERELLPGLVSKLQVELSDSGPEWATELNYSPEAR